MQIPYFLHVHGSTIFSRFVSFVDFTIFRRFVKITSAKIKIIMAQDGRWYKVVKINSQNKFKKINSIIKANSQNRCTCTQPLKILHYTVACKLCLFSRWKIFANLAFLVFRRINFYEQFADCPTWQQRCRILWWKIFTMKQTMQNLQKYFTTKINRIRYTMWKQEHRISRFLFSPTKQKKTKKS